LPELVRAGAVHVAPARAVELLYFDGCPSYEALLLRLRELLRQVNAGDDVILRRIPDERTAQRERFLGSPTVRVDGEDIEPGARERDDFGIKCRLYATDNGLRTTPLDEWVLDALWGRGGSS